MRGPWRTERASATPLVLTVVAIALLMAAGVARVGGASVRAARSAAAADLTALAAATSGEGVAAPTGAPARVAAAGGAELLEVVPRDGGAVEVTVRADGAVTRAAAALTAPGEPRQGG